LELTASSPAMVGMETFAMETSSTLVKTASASENVTSARGPAGSSGCASPLAAIVLLRPGVGRDDLPDQLIGVRLPLFIHIRGSGRFGARHHGKHLAAGVMKIHLDRHGKPQPQRVLLHIFGVQPNAHGHPSHDLDPVAGSVLWWEQFERSTRTGADALHCPVVGDITPVKI